MKVIQGINSREIPVLVEFADSFFARFRGLMFRRGIQEYQALMLTPCNSIHMFFMFFPIDAIFLDEKGVIIRVVENLKPWSAVMPVRNAGSVLELSAGFCRKHKLGVGDQIVFS